MLWQYSRRDTKLLLLATLLVFSGYALVLGHAWQQVAVARPFQLAQSVGVFAGVPEHEVNRYMMELDTRARELDARETALAQRSIPDTRTLAWVTVLGSLLLGLILLNFYLDYRRRFTFTS